MSTSRVVWTGEEDFVGTERGGQTVSLSSLGGEGTRPTAVLGMALGACIAVSVVRIMSKKRQPLTGLEIDIRCEQDPDPPWEFRSIGLHFRVRGERVDARGLEQAIAIADHKYCAVSASLRPKVQITTTCEVVAA